MGWLPHLHRGYYSFFKSMILHNNQNRERFFLFVFGFIYVCFIINDLSASVQTGFKHANRSGVYFWIITITAFLLLVFLLEIKKIIVHPILLALFLLAAWTTIVNLLKGVETWTICVQGNMSVMWILSFIFFDSMRRKDTSEKPVVHVLTLCLAVFFVVVTIYYFFDMMERIGRIPVLTVVYYLLALFPWMCVHMSTKGKSIWYVIILLISLLSMKRGAIIAVLVMLGGDLFFDRFFHKVNGKTVLRTMCIIAVIVFSIVCADKLSSGFLSERFSWASLSEGSGRNHQLKSVVQEVIHRGSVDFFFGVGCERCVKVFGTGIHNEWLSFLYNYGFVGLGLYLYLFVGMVSSAVSARKTCPELASPAYMSLVLFLILSMISTAYGGYIGLWIFGFWGYLNAERDCRVSG